MFTINIERKLEKNVPFDYFVDNANLAEVNIEILNNYKAKEENKVKIDSKHQSSKRIQLQEYSDMMPPSSPPDPNSAWTWFKNAGFVKTLNVPK